MPALHIDIEARFAKFQDALSSIEKNTQKTANNMTRAFSGVKSAMAGLGVGISVAGLVAVTKNAIDAADHLNDLSQSTGISVSTLGGLGFAAGKAGGDLDSVANAAGKLNKSIAEAAGGNKSYMEAFSALGISVLDSAGNVKKADVIMAEIASKFEGFEDGPQKAAIALRLFGKSGADIIPLLNEGGESLRQNIELYKQYGGVTDEVAKRSDQFNDTMANIGLMTGSFGRTLAAELLPSLQSLASYMLDAKNKGDAFKTAAGGVATALKALIGVGASVAYVFKGIGTMIGGTLAIMDRLAVWDFKGAKTIRENLQKEMDGSRQDFEKFMTNMQKGTPPALPTADGKGKGGKEGGKPPAPTLRTGSGAADKDDPARRILEGQLKALDRLSDEERSLMATRQEFLQTFYQQDLISITDYYDARRAVQEEALRAQLANIDKEIALLEGSRPKDKRGAAERDNKVAELTSKKATLEKEAGEAAIKLSIEQTEAARNFQRALDDINTTLLEQHGHLTEAAAIRFDQQYEGLTNKVKAERQSAVERGDDATVAKRDSDLEKLATLRELTVARAKMNGLESVGVQIQDDLAIATERAMLAQQTGAVTELESLRMVSDARLQSAADLQKVADAFAEVAAAAGDPAMIRQAQAMQLEVEKLAASADLVRERFADVFSSGFESALDKLMSGTASIKDVLKGFVNDIGADIRQMVARNLSQQLFSKEGALGGIPDFFSGLFGGKSQANLEASGNVTDAIAAASKDTSLSLQTQAIDTNRVAMDNLTTAAQNAATVLANLPTTAGVTSVDVNSIPPVDGELPAVSDTVGDFGKTAISAASDISRLASAAGIGGDAMQRLPGIIGLFQSAIMAMSVSSGGKSGGGLIGTLFSMFASSAGPSGAGVEVAAHALGQFRDGAAFDLGKVIPFAKGGLPSSIVDAPTFFPMAGGRTGLMGEAGPEAIMPLKRDEHGDLAVTVVGEQGKVSLLPVTRDPQGRLAVRAAEAFAKGAAFNRGSIERFATGGVVRRTAESVFTQQVMDASPAPSKGGDTYNITVPYTAQPNVSRAAAQQQGVEFGRGIERSMRRNG